MSTRLLTTVLLTADQICNSNDHTVILVSVREGEEYKDGKPTGNIDHYKYNVALPFNSYEKIIVKIKGSPIITKEQIVQNNGGISIRFKNLTGKFYRSGNGTYALTASADGLEVIG